MSPSYVERPGLLEQVDEYLACDIHPTPTPAHLAIIHGLAGSGKSQLTRRFGFLKQKSGMPVYWIDATSSATLSTSFFKFAAEAGICSNHETLNSDSDYIRKKVCSYFTDLQIDWLLIFDNYDVLASGEIEAFDIRTFFPRSEHARIIVTSRNRGVQNIIGGSLFEVTGMRSDEALSLFLACSGLQQSSLTIKECDIAKEISYDLLSSYPLAIAQGGAYIRQFWSQEQSAISQLQSYRKQYIAHEAEMLDGKDSSKVLEYGKSVIATWNMSFKVIVQHAPSAAQLLLLLGFFHHSDIPISIFSRAFARRAKLYQDDGMSQCSTSFAFISKLLGSSESGEWDRTYQFDPAIRVLENYALVRLAGQELLNIHPLVHKWTVICSQSPGFLSLQERAQLALALIGGVHDKNVSTWSLKWYTMQLRLSNHVDACLKKAQAYTRLLDPRAPAVVPAATFLRVRHVLNSGVESVENKAKRLSAKLSLLALGNGCRLDGIAHISTLQALRTSLIDFMDLQIAESYSQVVEASKVLQEYLPESCKNESGRDLHESHVSFWLTRCMAILRLGDWSRTLAECKECFKFIDQHQLEMSLPYYLILKQAFLSMLASAAGEGVSKKIQQDRNQEILTMLQSLLIECQDTEGDSAYVTVSVINTKAHCLRVLGNRQAAAELSQAVLEKCEDFPEVLGPLALRAVIILGWCALEEGDIESRLKTHVQHEAMEASQGGPYHPDTLFQKRSILECEMERRQKAGHLQNPRVFGSDHWAGRDDRLVIPAELAIGYLAFGEVEKVGDMWDGVIAYAQLEEMPGADLRDFALAFNFAAIAVQQQGNSKSSQHLRKLVALTGKEYKKQRDMQKGELRSRQLRRLRDLWNLLRTMKVEAPPDAAATEARRLLGSEICNTMQEAPPACKSALLFVCVHYLSNLFYTEGAVLSSPPIDMRSLSVVSLMASGCFGADNIVVLEMKFVIAITLRLLGPTKPINMAEDHIIRLRIANVARQDVSGLGPSSILERLQIDYKRRGWYEAQIMIYRKVLDAFIPGLGVEHEKTAASILLFLNACARGSQDDVFDGFLKSDLSAAYEEASLTRKPSIIESLRKTGGSLNAEGHHEYSIKILKWVWKRGEPMAIAEGDQSLWWRCVMMNWFKVAYEALGNGRERQTEYYRQQEDELWVKIRAFDARKAKEKAAPTESTE